MSGDTVIIDLVVTRAGWRRRCLGQLVTWCIALLVFGIIGNATIVSTTAPDPILLYRSNSGSFTGISYYTGLLLLTSYKQDRVMVQQRAYACYYKRYVSSVRVFCVSTENVLCSAKNNNSKRGPRDAMHGDS